MCRHDPFETQRTFIQVDGVVHELLPRRLVRERRELRILGRDATILVHRGRRQIQRSHWVFTA
jgi:hypothetical protein